MGEFVIACEMLRDELTLAAERAGVQPEIVWLEKGLHDTPAKLRLAVQQAVDAAEAEHDLILLALTWCGGGLDGVGSERAALAAPRFDDCIRLLLSREAGQTNEADCRSLYLTRGWMDSDRYLLRDFEKYRREYGERGARRIIRAMLANYRSLHLIDTGAYPLSNYVPAARRDAASLGLAFGEQPGTVRVLEKLLRRELDGEFCVLKPGERFAQRMFLHLP